LVSSFIICVNLRNLRISPSKLKQDPSADYTDFTQMKNDEARNQNQKRQTGNAEL